MKQLVRRAFRSLGYDIRRIAASSHNAVGQDPWDDMATFLRVERPVIFDVGANVDQAIKQIRPRFPTPLNPLHRPSKGQGRTTDALLVHESLISARS